MADVVLCVVMAICVLSVVWGYAVAYQAGYHKAEAHLSQEVAHA